MRDSGASPAVVTRYGTGMPPSNPRRRVLRPATAERVPRWSSVSYNRMAKANANYARLSPAARLLLARLSYMADRHGHVELQLSTVSKDERAVVAELGQGNWLKAQESCCEAVCWVVARVALPRGEPRETL